MSDLISTEAKKAALVILLPVGEHQKYLDVKTWTEKTVPSNLYGTALEIQQFGNSACRPLVEALEHVTKTFHGYTKVEEALDAHRKEHG